MVVIFLEEPSGEPVRVGGVASVDGGEGLDDELVHLLFVGDVDGISFFGVWVFEVGEGGRQPAQSFVGVAHVASVVFAPAFDTFSLIGGVELVEKLVEVSGKGGEFGDDAMEVIAWGVAISESDGIEVGVQIGEVDVSGRKVVGVFENAGDSGNVEVAKGSFVKAGGVFKDDLEPANDSVEAAAVPLEGLSLRGGVVWRDAAGLGVNDGGVLFEVFGDGHLAFGGEVLFFGGVNAKEAPEGAIDEVTEVGPVIFEAEVVEGVGGAGKSLASVVHVGVELI